jgi:hypothetical protein
MLPDDHYYLAVPFLASLVSQVTHLPTRFPEILAVYENSIG